MIIEKLFQGKPKIFGGVTNIEGIINKCPKSFYQKNQWSSFIHIIMYKDLYDQTTWSWKSKDNNARQHEFSYLFGLMTAKIDIKDKLAIAGWYLSEILESVPEYKKQNTVN